MFRLCNDVAHAAFNKLISTSENISLFDQGSFTAVQSRTASVLACECEVFL